MALITDEMIQVLKKDQYYHRKLYGSDVIIMSATIFLAILAYSSLLPLSSSYYGNPFYTFAQTTRSTDDYNKRKGRVLELYDQGKNTREIAKEPRMSLRDIGFILKKGQVNHGITATIMDNGNGNNGSNDNKPANGRLPQAYEIFSEGKTPVEVAIQLSLSEKEAIRFYTEYWRLKRIYGLCQIYQESNGNLSYIMKLWN